MSAPVRKPGRPVNTSTGPAREIERVEIFRLTRLIHGPHEARDRALVHLTLSGLRISEACGLTVADVDLTSGTALVQAHKSKSRRSRVSYLTSEAVRYIRDYLQERGPVEPTAPLLLSQKGSHLHAGYGARLWKRLATEAGLSRCSSHSGRRTAANELLRRGGSIATVQATLGHASLQTTSAYIAAQPHDLREAMARVRWGT